MIVDPSEAAEPFALSPTDEDALAASIAEADRGDVVSADELLQRLYRI